MIRRHHRSPVRGSSSFTTSTFLRSRCDPGAGRKHAGIRASAPKVWPQVDALQPSLSIWVASPRIHSLKSPSTIFGRPTRRSWRIAAQPLGLITAFEKAVPRWTLKKCRVPPRMRSPPAGCSGARRSSRTSRGANGGGSGSLLSTTLPNMLASSRIGAITQPMPSRAPNSSACPLPLGVGADHFLQGDNIGIDRREHVDDALRFVRRSSPRHRWML